MYPRVFLNRVAFILERTLILTLDSRMFERVPVWEDWPEVVLIDHKTGVRKIRQPDSPMPVDISYKLL